MVSLSHLNKFRRKRRLRFTECEYGPNAILSLRNTVSLADFASIPLEDKSNTQLFIKMMYKGRWDIFGKPEKVLTDSEPAMSKNKPACITKLMSRLMIRILEKWHAIDIVF